MPMFNNSFRFVAILLGGENKILSDMINIIIKINYTLNII